MSRAEAWFVVTSHDMTGWDNQKYGEQAENLVKGLMLPNFYCTAPLPDIDGWDLMVRSRHAARGDGFQALLKQSPAFRYLIQVKSVLRKNPQGKPNRVSVSLERVLASAEDSNPWFYFVVRHSEKWEPAELFVFHIDREWIERVARRICEEPQGDVSRMTIDFPLIEKYSVERSESAVCECIIRACGDDSSAYSAQKRQWWRGAGLESEESLVRFNTEAGDAGTQAVSDLLLGLRSIDGARVSQVETRFGQKFEEVLTSNARVFVQPVAHPEMSISSKLSGRSVSVQTKLYTNSGLEKVDSSARFAMRLDAGVVSVTIFPKEMDAELKMAPINWGEVVRIQQLSSCASLLRLLDKASQTKEILSLHIGSSGKLTMPLGLQFEVNEPMPLESWVRQVYDRGHELSEFARLHGEFRDLECSVLELLDVGPMITAATLLAGLERHELCIEVQAESAPPTPVVVVPMAPAFSISGYNGYAAGYVQGQCQPKGGKDGVFVIKNPEIVLVRSEFGKDNINTAEHLGYGREVLKSSIGALADVTVLRFEAFVCETFRHYEPSNKAGSTEANGG